MEHNVLTGTTSARLHKLILKNQQGSYQNILDLMATSQALMQIYVGGVLYSSATALNFANASHILDPVTGIMNIGAPLYQGFVRIGTSTTYTDLTRGSAGELLWDGNQVALAGSGGSSLDLYVNGSLVSPAATGLNFSNHSNSLDPNTGILTLGPVLSQTLLRLGTNAVYGDLTRGSGGELLWGGNPVSALAHYSETSGATTTIVQSFDTTTPISTHISWLGNGSYSNVAGSHQQLNLPSVFINYFNQPAGTKVFMSVDLRAGTATEVVFATHDGSAWFDTITFQGLSGTTWTNYTWSFTVTAAGRVQFGVGYVPTNLGVNMNFTNQSSGTILIRNLHLYATADLATISAALTCQKDVTFNASIESQHAYIINAITAANYFSSSDERLKTNVQDAPPEACQQVFDAVQVKTYERTDLAGKRIGFIAQDVQGNLPEEFANLVGTRPSEDGVPYLTLDYSRLVTVLWGVVKNLQARIEALEAG
jgi:hypothetical protein